MVASISSGSIPAAAKILPTAPTVRPPPGTLPIRPFKNPSPPVGVEPPLNIAELIPLKLLKFVGKKPFIPKAPPGKPKAPIPKIAALPKGDLTNFLTPLPMLFTKLPNPYSCLGSCIRDIAIMLSKFKLKAGVLILKYHTLFDFFTIVNRF